MGGFNVGAMTNTTISKHARQAARKAAAAAAEELAARNRANVEDLATFFNAHERADGVDEWLAERQAALQEQARQRRSGFVRDGGLALRAMRVRGESVREIAAMTGLTEKGVRDAIRAAEAIVPVPDAESSPQTVEVARRGGELLNGSADGRDGDAGRELTRRSCLSECSAMMMFGAADRSAAVIGERRGGHGRLATATAGCRPDRSCG